MVIDLAYIARMAPIWRARKPSGRFVLHRLPHDRRRLCLCLRLGLPLL